MTSEVKVQFSAALVVLVLVHAALIGIVMPQCVCEPCSSSGDGFTLPGARPSPTPTGSTIEKLREPPPVNMEAQSEMKGQCPPGYRVVPCTPTYRPVRPAAPAPPARPVAPKPIIIPASKPSAEPSKPVLVTPASNSSASPAVTPTPNKRYQIALFLDDSGQSLQIKRWFESDPNLSKLRNRCEFQIFRADNVLYQQRYADIVPVGQFPVVLFQDSSGGHLHAAGRTMLPSTPGELYADMEYGYRLYQQTRQAEATGLVKARGYSWDDAIGPSMQLTSQDCPDGYCPTPNQPSDRWRPFDRDTPDRDSLFDRVDSTRRNAFIWANAGELATFALIGIAAVLVLVILVRRGAIGS